VSPPRLCRDQNPEMLAGADENRSSRHILSVGIPFLTIRIPKEWAEIGEMIIRTVSKQATGGVTV